MARVVRKRKSPAAVDSVGRAARKASRRSAGAELLRVHGEACGACTSASSSTGARERGIAEPVEVTRTVLESYQRHVFHYRKKNGEPLSFTSQHDRLVPLRVLVPLDGAAASHPAQSGLRTGAAAPRHPPAQAVLTARKPSRCWRRPAVHDPLGLRDRAILETFYSTGMRRAELVQLKLYDLDAERGTRDHPPGQGQEGPHHSARRPRRGVGRKYLEEARPRLVREPDDSSCFSRTPASRSRRTTSRNWCAATWTPPR